MAFGGLQHGKDFREHFQQLGEEELHCAHLLIHLLILTKEHFELLTYIIM